MAKLPWSGKIISVQPRIRLLRSFDQRSHTYLGYCLFIDGAIGNEVRQFSIGVGKAAHQKHQFKVGDGVCGERLAGGFVHGASGRVHACSGPVSSDAPASR